MGRERKALCCPSVCAVATFICVEASLVCRSVGRESYRKDVAQSKARLGWVSVRGSVLSPSASRESLWEKCSMFLREQRVRPALRKRLFLACLVASKACSYLVDPASSHMLVSKIKPCMSKYKHLYCETANGSLNQLSFI